MKEATNERTNAANISVIATILVTRCLLVQNIEVHDLFINPLNLVNHLYIWYTVSGEGVRM